MRRLAACVALISTAGATAALAQDITISLGEGTSLTERAVQLRASGSSRRRRTC